MAVSQHNMHNIDHGYKVIGPVMAKLGDYLDIIILMINIILLIGRRMGTGEVSFFLLLSIPLLLKYWYWTCYWMTLLYMCVTIECGHQCYWTVLSVQCTIPASYNLSWQPNIMSLNAYTQWYCCVGGVAINLPSVLPVL